MEHLVNSVLPLTTKKILNLNLIAQMFFSFWFTVASIHMMTFSVAMTTMSWLLLATCGLYTVNKATNLLTIGVSLGGGVVITIMSLMSIVYFDTYSQKFAHDVTASKLSMHFALFFSVLMFLLQFLFTWMIFIYKDVLVAEAKLYSQLPTSGSDYDDGDEDSSWNILTINSSIAQAHVIV